jgi:hypothetical protein
MPYLSSFDPDGDRASRFLHLVQDMDGDENVVLIRCDQLPGSRDRAGTAAWHAAADAAATDEVPAGGCRARGCNSIGRANPLKRPQPRLHLPAQRILDPAGCREQQRIALREAQHL